MIGFPMGFPDWLPMASDGFRWAFRGKTVLIRKLRQFRGWFVAYLCRNYVFSAIIFVMDAVDRKILAELQAEGRLTVTELAERVSLSVAPCHRRLRELERTRAIRGYRAIIDPAAIGLGFEVLVQVTMDREDATTIARFESELAEIPEVRHAERLFGDPDYLVRVATADLAAYQALRDEKLAALPGVQRLSSTIVMKRIVDDRPYPVTPARGGPRG
jgi:DNA-binding Lrp family transcriptional regulator